MLLLLLAVACGPSGEDTPAGDTGDSGDTGDTGDTADTGGPDAIPPGPYHPELTAWPRLVALPGDLDTIRARVAGTASTDPEVNAAWAELHATIVSSCDRTAPVPDLSGSYDYARAWPAAAIARNCAFLGWLDADAARARRAVDLLGTLPTDASTLSDASYDVHLSTQLGLMAEAYDLVRGSGQDVDLDAAAAPVRALAASLYDRYVVREWAWFLVWQNNHNTKLASALGMVGLVLNDEDAASTYVSYAQTEIPWIAEVNRAGGAYGEGFYYLAYGAQEALPYLRAYHRLLGDTGEAFPTECNTRPGADCVQGAPVVTGDLWDSPAIQAMWAWSREFRMPNGQRPPVDDGVPEGFPSALLDELDPAYGWDWLTQEPRYVTWAGDSSVDLLCGFTGRAAEPPAATSGRDDEAGFLWVGSGRGADDTWALLLAERPGPGTNNGHEHPDLGSLQLWAGGEYWLIDTGYAGYDDRAYTNDYADHNGVLVDGEAPEVADAGDITAVEGAAAGWRMETTTGAWTRLASLADGPGAGDAVVVDDTLEAAGHTYQWRWHLLTGAGRGEWAPDAVGGVVTHGEARLAVVVCAAQGGVTLGAESGDDALTYGDLEQHDVLTATATATSTGSRVRTAFVPLPAESAGVLGCSAGAPTVDGVVYPGAG